MCSSDLILVQITTTGALKAVPVSVTLTLLQLLALKAFTSISTDVLVFAPLKLALLEKSGTTICANVFVFQRSALITTGSTTTAVSVSANLTTVLKASIGKLRIANAFAEFQKIVKQLKPPI